ncbi:MAG: hypothetical protein GY874_23630 [Desulfobacteraceae bacterium]|nr:hypothetical protein [Desulfobacteraceae bacterium]
MDRSDFSAEHINNRIDSFNTPQVLSLNRLKPISAEKDIRAKRQSRSTVSNQIRLLKNKYPAGIKLEKNVKSASNETIIDNLKKNYIELDQVANFFLKHKKSCYFKYNGQKGILKWDDKASRFVMTLSHKPKRFQIAGLLCDGNVQPGKDVYIKNAQIRLSCLAMRSLMTRNIIDMKEEKKELFFLIQDRMVVIEKNIEAKKQQLNIGHLKGLSFIGDEKWRFYDQQFDGKFYIPTDNLLKISRADSPLAIKNNATLLGKFTNTFSKRAILQGQFAKKMCTLGDMSEPAQVPFIDGFDDLDVAAAQGKWPLIGVFKAFMVLPFAVMILDEGENGAAADYQHHKSKLDQQLIDYFKNRKDLIEKAGRDLNNILEIMAGNDNDPDTQKKIEKKISSVIQDWGAGKSDQQNLNNDANLQTAMTNILFNKKIQKLLSLDHDTFMQKIRELSSKFPNNSQMDGLLDLMDDLNTNWQEILEQKNDLKLNAAEKDAITAMSWALKLHFANEAINLPITLLASSHAGMMNFAAGLNSIGFPLANITASYGQEIYCISSFISAYNAIKERNSIKEVIETVINHSAFDENLSKQEKSALRNLIHHHTRLAKDKKLENTEEMTRHLKNMRDDISGFLKSKKNQTLSKAGCNALVGVGQALMLAATISAAAVDGGASLSVLGGAVSAIEAAPVYSDILRATGAGTTLAAAGANSVLEAVCEKKFQTGGSDDSWKAIVNSPDLSIPVKLIYLDLLARKHAAPQYIEAKIGQLIAANSPNHGVEEIAQRVINHKRWTDNLIITKNTSLAAHYSEKNRPYYRPIRKSVEELKVNNKHRERIESLTRNIKKDPLEFYAKVFENSGIKAFSQFPVQGTDAEKMTWMIDKLRKSGQYEKFHEILMDKMIIGKRFEGKYQYNGKSFERYFYGTKIKKSRIGIKNNPIQQLVDGTISKTVKGIQWLLRKAGYDAGLKGKGYYKFKRFFTLRWGMPLPQKSKHVRWFDSRQFVDDLQDKNRKYDPAVISLKELIYDSMKSVLDNWVSDRKIHFRDIYFKAPVECLEGKN